MVLLGVMDSISAVGFSVVLGMWESKEEEGMEAKARGISEKVGETVGKTASRWVQGEVHQETESPRMGESQGGFPLLYQGGGMKVER